MENFPKRESNSTTYDKLKKLLPIMLAAFSLDANAGIVVESPKPKPANVLKAVPDLNRPKIKKDNPQRDYLLNPNSIYYKRFKKNSSPDLKSPEEAKDAFEKIDSQREWFANVVHSPEYKEKAIKNEKLNTAQLAERLKKSILDNIRLEEEQTYNQNAYHITDPTEVGNYDDGTITLRYADMPEYMKKKYLAEKFQDAPIGIHELEHSVTDSNNLLSKKAKQLYRKAFIQNGNKERDAYFGDPTEIDARRRVFQYELERNGVWKYGEIFTKKHLEKALELVKEGKLSKDAADFLIIVQNEKIPEIINTIADNKINNDNKNEEIG